VVLFSQPKHRSIVRDLNSAVYTVFKIVYSAVDEKPEMQFICLKGLVGERGFEPPTPWSRTRFESLLKSPEIWRF
jgi:hypothetical protein